MRAGEIPPFVVFFCVGKIIATAGSATDDDSRLMWVWEVLPTNCFGRVGEPKTLLAKIEIAYIPNSSV
jgi:hypothetical protein